MSDQSYRPPNTPAGFGPPPLEPPGNTGQPPYPPPPAPGSPAVPMPSFAPSPQAVQQAYAPPPPPYAPSYPSDNLLSPASDDPARRGLQQVRDEVGKAVVGQADAVTGLIVGLLCDGHVLLEGVPGVAKTLLVRSLAASLSLETKRVQFTPDL
ncbi:MAG: MoxR family ATPase, partial [Propionibacteriaceae bacterium]|nr:MoxR family ATPase [Propionibacteriaceae bacterium]